MIDLQNILTLQEIDFVLKVMAMPGSKHDYESTHHYVNDDTEYGNHISLWKKPEDLGLIKCVGSYKWIPGPNLKMKIFMSNVVRDSI